MLIIVTKKVRLDIKLYVYERVSPKKLFKDLKYKFKISTNKKQ